MEAQGHRRSVVWVFVVGRRYQISVDWGAWPGRTVNPHSSEPRSRRRSDCGLLPRLQPGSISNAVQHFQRRLASNPTSGLTWKRRSLNQEHALASRLRDYLKRTWVAHDELGLRDFADEG